MREVIVWLWRYAIGDGKEIHVFAILYALCMEVQVSEVFCVMSGTWSDMSIPFDVIERIPHFLCLCIHHLLSRFEVVPFNSVEISNVQKFFAFQDDAVMEMVEVVGVAQHCDTSVIVRAEGMGSGIRRCAGIQHIIYNKRNFVFWKILFDVE